MTFLSILYSLGSSLTTLLLLLTFLILLFIVICLNLLVSFPFPSLCSPPLLFPSPLTLFLDISSPRFPQFLFPFSVLIFTFPLLVYFLPYSLSSPCSLFLFIPPLV